MSHLMPVAGSERMGTAAPSRLYLYLFVIFLLFQFQNKKFVEWSVWFIQ